MAEFKLVISDPQSGKSVQREAKDDVAKHFLGLKIKDKVKGELLDLTGYELEITGGSDYCGFPMRYDVTGTARKRIVDVKGVGFHNKLRKPNPKKKGWRTIRGMRQKKMVAGNTIHDKIAQVNLKVVKKGKEDIFAAPPAPASEAEKKE
ncbi:30S ribosomal protein S6e [Candidatus Woesearchaeota archaeon]|nr:30S ribosomal protein S6e [Candidatus Woesearchaeota archaeon]